MKPIKHGDDKRCICTDCPPGVDDMFWREDDEAACERNARARFNMNNKTPKKIYIPRKRVTISKIDSKEAGKIIREIREGKKMTVSALAGAMRISVPHLSLLERGKRDWTEENIERAEKVLKR